MRFDCAESLLMATVVDVDGYNWSLHITVVAHFDTISDRALDVMKLRTARLLTDSDAAELLRFFLSAISRQKKRVVSVWEVVNEDASDASAVETTLHNLQRKLALEASVAFLPSNKTLNLQFQVNYDTLMTFHKTYIPHALFVPDSPL